MSAIQTDVQTEQQNNDTSNNTAAAPVKTARELAMEAIEARHHEQAAADNGYQLSMDDDSPPDDDSAAQLAAQLAAEQSSNTQAATTAAPAAPAAAPATVKVKVDGEETDVALDDIVRQYQKNASADKRLAEATRLLREAQEREAQFLLQQQAAAQQAAAAAAATAPQAETTNTTDPQVAESGKEFLKALFEGDEENALNALNKVMQGRPAQPVAAAPTLDVNQITANVAQQVQYQMAVDRALEANRRDYPELYADADVEELAAAKIHSMRQQGVDFFTALNTVSKDFATKFHWGTQRTEPGRPAETTPPTTNTAREAKLANKQQIDNVASISTKTVTTDEVPDTHSSIIAQMKAARGGGV